VTRTGSVTTFQAAPSDQFLPEQFAWSPDGSRLLYVASVSFDDYQVFVIDADGTGKAAVGPPGDYDFRSIA
jgi:hypothetical protein